MADDPKRLLHGDLLVLQGLSRQEHVEMPGEGRLVGMLRQLDPGERVALAYFRASIMVLNRKGAFREDFLAGFEQDLTTPNSDPSSMEEPDWEIADDGKKRRP